MSLNMAEETLQTQSALIDEVDSEDEWYARMEAAAADRDEADYVDNTQVQPETSALNSGTISDEAYYNGILDYNCNVVTGGFSSESDPIWYSMLKAAAKTSATIPPEGQLLYVQPTDAASVILAQQWAFGYLPKSSRIYMELGVYADADNDNCEMYTDDLVHPSLVVLVHFVHAVHRMEVSLFSPYSSSEADFASLFRTIERLRVSSGLDDVVFCGTDRVHYEQALSTHARWKQTWIEVCGMYVYADYSAPEVADIGNIAYVLDDLRWALVTFGSNTLGSNLSF